MEKREPHSDTDLPQELSSSFIRGLAHLVGRHGVAGESRGRAGYRLVMRSGDKSIDVISLVGQNSMLMTLGLAGDIPEESMIHTYKSVTENGGEVLIKWDKRISLRDVEIAMKFLESDTSSTPQ